MEGKTYIPAKPCKRGHLLRYLSTKSCVICSRVACAEDHRRNRDRNNARKKLWWAANRVKELPKLKLRSAEWYRQNRDRAQAKNRAWHLNNSGRALSNAIKWRSENRGRRLAKAALYKKQHRAEERAWVAMRRAHKLQATPHWLSDEQWQQIFNIYAEAERLTRETGIKHHVDHIIPLKGKTVTGLHVPWNLQPLPAIENMRKLNKLQLN